MMNIVVATDDNFVQHCSVMLVSLLTNNENVNVFILTEGLTTPNKQIIEDELSRFGVKPEYLLVNSAIVEKFPMPDNSGLKHISRATYYRLLIADIIDDSIDKIIYFDCDIIINHSIKDLWDIDISDYAIAAVPQIGAGNEAERLGYPIQYGYFNAGVTVMNLKYCREHDITKLFIEYLDQNASKILFHDQDTLNAVLYDKCYHLLPMWNMTSINYIIDLKSRGDARDGVIINDYCMEKENTFQYRKDPIVLHYVSKPKPWQKNCFHPLYYLYFHYARKTIHYNKLEPQNNVVLFFARMRFNCICLLSAIKQRVYKTDLSRI